MESLVWYGNILTKTAKCYKKIVQTSNRWYGSMIHNNITVLFRRNNFPNNRTLNFTTPLSPPQMYNDDGEIERTLVFLKNNIYTFYFENHHYIEQLVI